LSKLPNVKAIVLFNTDSLPKEFSSDKRIILWDDFLILGKDVADCVIDEKVHK